MIIQLFDSLFLDCENTQLIGGADEPLYIPSISKNKPHQLLFRENFLSSALHEIAHWCIAGKKRRLQQDFGYWYEPDGRTVVQQAHFESVEVKPQALEWLFSNACGQKFTPSSDNLSADNLNALVQDSKAVDKAFNQALVKQATHWCHTQQLPPRAKLFIDELKKQFDSADPFNLEYYQLSYLD
jgi:elongation factor P hydroxylase